MVDWHINLEPETTTEYAGTRLGSYYTDPEMLRLSNTTSSEPAHERRFISRSMQTC